MCTVKAISESTLPAIHSIKWEMDAKNKVKTEQDSSKLSVTRVRSPPYGKQVVRWALLITRRVTSCTASMWLERQTRGEGRVGNRESEWERWPNTRKKQWSHTTWLIFPADTSSPNHNIPAHVCVCMFVVRGWGESVYMWECVGQQSFICMCVFHSRRGKIVFALSVCRVNNIRKMKKVGLKQSTMILMINFSIIRLIHNLFSRSSFSSVRICSFCLFYVIKHNVSGMFLAFSLFVLIL